MLLYFVDMIKSFPHKGLKRFFTTGTTAGINPEHGRSPESWLLMQDNYDLWNARKKIDLNNYETIEFAV